LAMEYERQDHALYRGKTYDLGWGLVGRVMHYDDYCSVRNENRDKGKTGDGIIPMPIMGGETPDEYIRDGKAWLDSRENPPRTEGGARGLWYAYARLDREQRAKSLAKGRALKAAAAAVRPAGSTRLPVGHPSGSFVPAPTSSTRPDNRATLQGSGALSSPGNPFPPQAARSSIAADLVRRGPAVGAVEWGLAGFEPQSFVEACACAHYAASETRRLRGLFASLDQDWRNGQETRARAHAALEMRVDELDAQVTVLRRQNRQMVTELQELDLLVKSEVTKRRALQLKVFHRQAGLPPSSS
jgi:hypothetical protein